MQFAQNSSPEPSMTKPRSILVVDDDDNLVYTLSMFLRSQGYEVFTAQNGLQGCGQYFKHPTDFVLTDIEMPEMDGFEMMRCIRSLNPRVRAIFASGALERFKQDVESERREHDAKVLLKPFSTWAIIELVNAQPSAAQA
jgi:CheY-like chemotaxis protein